MVVELLEWSNTLEVHTWGYKVALTYGTFRGCDSLTFRARNPLSINSSNNNSPLSTQLHPFTLPNPNSSTQNVSPQSHPPRTLIYLPASITRRHLLHRPLPALPRRHHHPARLPGLKSHLPHPSPRRRHTAPRRPGRRAGPAAVRALPVERGRPARGYG